MTQSVSVRGHGIKFGGEKGEGRCSKDSLGYLQGRDGGRGFVTPSASIFLSDNVVLEVNATLQHFSKLFGDVIFHLAEISFLK